jgi:hypothetical protein
MVNGRLNRDRKVPKESGSIFHGGESFNPAFSDVSFQNERAMWWAEFDSIGEDAVRDYVARNSYTPTGMEIAREWLARREFLQLREEVQSLKALAERAQATVSPSPDGGSEALMLAGQVDANSRAIAEIAAAVKKNAWIMILVGTVASLLALGAIVMVASRPPPASLPVAPKPASAPPAKQAVMQPAPVPASVPATAPPAMPAAVPPMDAPRPPGQASATPAENAQTAQPSNAAPDLKPEGQSLTEVLALIADKVGGEGAINFTSQFHDRTTGRDHIEQFSYRASNATIDPNRCQVGYRWHVEQNGKAVSDQDRAVELRLAKSIKVTSIDAESGRRFSMRAYPKVYVVDIARWDNASGDALYFHDQGTAARVGAAARRAVELCDSGERRRGPAVSQRRR